MPRLGVAALLGALVLFAGAASASSAPRPGKHAPKATLPAAEKRLVKESVRVPFKVRVDRITKEEGLPQNGGTAIVQDAFGFMWLGTETGVVRFDGHQLELPVLGDSAPGAVKRTFITALAADDEGKVWIGTSDSGLTEYDASTGRYSVHTTDSARIELDGITALARGKSRIWIATSGGVTWVDLKTNKFGTQDERVDELAQPYTAIREDSAGNVWLGTASDTAVRFDPGADKITKFPLELGEHTTIKAFAEDKDGDLWIGTTNGLARLSLKTGAIKRYTLSDPSVNALLVDSGGTLWAGTNTGVDILVDRARGRFATMQNDPTDANSLPQGVVLSLFEDRESVVWVGTRSGGIGKFGQQRRQFSPFSFASAVGAIHGSADGTMWVGLSQLGLLKLGPDRRNGTIYCDGDAFVCKGSGGGYSWIISIAETGDGVLWAGTDGKGLVAFDPGREDVRYVPEVASRQINSVEVGQDGLLWLGTWGEGLLSYDPKTRKVEAFTHQANQAGSLSSNHIYAVHRSRKHPGVLWVGTGDAGLVRFDTEKKTAEAFLADEPNEKALSDNLVVSLLEDDSGALWVGTWNGGLNRFDPETKTFQRLGDKQGAGSQTVLGLEISGKDKLWLSTHDGLLEFDIQKSDFASYGGDDGIHGGEFTQNAHGHSAGGELFFGGPQGLTGFRPDKLGATQSAPRVLLTAVKVFDQPVPTPKPLWEVDRVPLSYRDSVLAIAFAGLSYASKEGLRFEWRMEGGDDDQWHAVPQGERIAHLPSLSGGDYTFHLRAASRRSAWNDQIAPLRLSVSSPPWRTWWALLIYAGIVAGIVLGVLGYQGRRIQRLKEKARLANVEQELQLTGTIQSWFLPERTEYRDERSYLTGFYRPADRCSGDWWWYEPIPGGRHRVFVGDVTGHGAGPALLTASVATLCRMQQTADPPIPLDVGLKALHEEVFRVCRGKYQMTMSALEIDWRTGRISFFSAGGMPLIVFSGGTPNVFMVPGSPIGVGATFEVGTYEHQLNPGDRFAVFTDGIPETRRGNGRLLGNRWLTQMLERTYDMPAQQALETMIREIDRERGADPQDDDLTMVLGGLAGKS